ncbi:trehalose-6-phosphate synthase [Saccharopolyspora taberi]|uniref:Glycosyltransferase family 20 protein n=1 Tax=Saccharopolyspora taberi TaxID=60895 RepID=A0ABN3VGG2_9PSEU
MSAQEFVPGSAPRGTTLGERPTIVFVHDRCVVDLSPLVPGESTTGSRGSGPVEVPVHPGGWAINLVETPFPKVFVNSARSPHEHSIARDGPVRVSASGETFTVSLTRSGRALYRRSYERFVNPIIWKLQHGILTDGAFGAAERDAYGSGYRQVNRDTASNVCRQLSRLTGPVVVSWQDYQWYLAPALVRRWLERTGRPDVSMHHFVHIPFPPLEVWRRHLPEDVLRDLFGGLLGNDVVGFHTPESVENFLRCCRSVLDLPVDFDRGVVRLPSGRSTLAKAYPLPICDRRLRGLAQSSAVDAAVSELRRQVGSRKLIFRTERVDPAKNFLGSLHAYAKLLGETDIGDDVVYRARLLPSRESVAEWSALRQHIRAEAELLNERFGRAGWRPVDIEFQDDLVRAIAGYIRYDVLDVVPFADGMNQVSLEGPLLNRADGTVVLSRTAGSYGLLAPHCFGVEPYDVGDHAAALHTALRLDGPSRKRRSSGLRQVAARGDPLDWLCGQMDDAQWISKTSRCEAWSW